jgi:CRISPR-associated endonuclease/helicase Cas3
MYAHSLEERPVSEWEPLASHLLDVGELAGDFAGIFGWAAAGRVAGLLHDIGKASAEYQAYIAKPRDTGGSRGPDHSSAGAIEARKAYPARTGPLGQMLAYAIAGHHAGLADGARLEERLSATDRICAYTGWEAQAGALPPIQQLAPSVRPQRTKGGFYEAFLIRMLFSCLVDADFLATESFYDKADGRETERGKFAGLDVLAARLEAYMSGLAAKAKAKHTPVNALRARVLEHVISKADLTPGLFTLTVPTGGGKTLASLSFALRHAQQHGLRRVVYVIPFTSVIEQTAAVFRTALQTQDDVLEHHASFDWEAAQRRDDTDDEGRNGAGKLRKAAENWDAPIVVTTLCSSLKACSPAAHRAAASCTIWRAR